MGWRDVYCWRGPRPRAAPFKENSVKKVFGLFAIFATVGGALMFWRRRKSDDEFLDEELE